MSTAATIDNIQEELYQAKLGGLDGILQLMALHPLNNEMQNKCIKTVFAMIKRQIIAANLYAQRMGLEDSISDANAPVVAAPLPESPKAGGNKALEGLEEFIGIEVKERPTDAQAAMAVQLAVEAMRQHAKDPYPQKWGSRIVGLCGVEFSTLEADLLDSAIQEVLNAMANFPLAKAVQQWGAEQLLLLCERKGPTMAARVADRGAIGVIINSFLSAPGDPTIHHFGCQLLTVMMRGGELYQNEAKLGGLQPLMRSASVQFSDKRLHVIVLDCLTALEEEHRARR
jgi:hypothetical protein